jgi:hypothetical protein
MYASFYAELEKIALSRTSSKGEGSRGGKVVGHTKSGDPIYASSGGEPKSNLGRNLAIGGAALGAAAILGAALGGRGGSRAASKARSVAGGFSTGGFGSKARSAATNFGGGAQSASRGASAGARSAGRSASSSAGRAASSSAGRSARAKTDPYSAFKGRHERYKKAREAYEKAGGPEARGQGDKWREYTKAGDDYFGNEGGKGVWEAAKGAQQRRHETHKAYSKYESARKAYDKAGGPFAQGKGETWREYTKRGDNFYGKDHQGWQRAKAQDQAKHEKAKAWRRKGKESQGKTYGQGEGGPSSGGYRSDYRSAASAEPKAAWDKIPGVKDATTKAEARQAWLKQMKLHHPDRGGPTAKAQEINNAWDDVTSSAWYSKLAMAHWAKLASALFR